MLMRLKIQNLLFIEEADIAFGEGLNIITGETGAGKSAILLGLQLIAGERAEQQIIGQYKDVTIVEGWISKYVLPEELATSFPKGPLVIRREIYPSGKNRCFIDDAQVPLSMLRQITGKAIEIIDQASSQTLGDKETQRFILDLFSNALDTAQKLQLHFAQAQKTEKEYSAALALNLTKKQDLQWAQEDLACIEKINWQKEEEEALHQEHQHLVANQELEEKLAELSDVFQENIYRKKITSLEKCVRLDPSLAPLLARLKNLAIECDEISHAIAQKSAEIESDPGRFLQIEERMKALSQLKRRFGKTFEEVELKKNAYKEKIEELLHLDSRLAVLQKNLERQTLENDKISEELHLLRKTGSHLFAEAIEKELHSLNLPHAKVEIALTKQPLSMHGIDSIEFLFSANPDRKPSPIGECASGGELSRFFLSVKTVLAAKEENSCLVFDEIDGNVGGQTAVILGEKLQAIAKQKQVICITHFVQVAKLASRHFGVTKTQYNGKTQTQIGSLFGMSLEKEYQRMLGN